MQRYIGTKVITAEPLSLGDYNKRRGWPMPTNENPDRPGYFVQHTDDYVTWQPAEIFEKDFRPTDSLTFGLATEAAKQGHKIQRRGWNGKNMFVVYMPELSLPPFNTQGTERKVNDRTAKFIGEDTPLDVLPYFAMWTADKHWLPGWLASQTDMLAEDWQILD